MRWWRTGSPDGQRALQGSGERFLQEALRSETDECILWPYGRSGAYPTGQGHAEVARRAHGPRPEGTECAHSCGTPLCVNPRHLRWATHAENQADRVTHGTVPRGEASGTARLTEADVRDIRARLANGEVGARIAKSKGVSRHTVYGIAKGRLWAHVT